MKRLIVFLMFLPSVLCAVDTLEVSVMESGGDYTSIEAALDGHEQDLVTNDSVLVIEISGTWTSADVTEVTVNGYTTNSTHPIIIRAVGDSRHDGKWSTTAYRHERPTRALYAAFVVYEDDVYFEYLQVHQKSTSSSDCAFNLAYNSTSLPTNIRISYLIIKGTDGTGTSRKGINYNNAGDCDVWNCLFYDFSNTNSRAIESKGANSYIYNNTIRDCYQGIVLGTPGSLADSTIAINNLIDVCLSNNYTGTFDGDSDYNASDDATSTGGSNDRINQTFTFVYAGANDFHLASNDTGATNHGTDLSSDPKLAFSDDIDGETRSGTWDIGGDEYLSMTQIIMINQ